MARRRMRAVHRRLREAQGEFRPKPALPIVDELISTVLSQATSDTNRDRAFAGLKERFPTWEQAAQAGPNEVADAIRPGGIAEVKARRILAILRRIEQDEGAIDLTRLEALSDEEAAAYLSSLPGVGPKTAACVLVFSMGRHAFPIDTHVHRVARRLGWIGQKTSPEQAHATLAPRIPPEIRYDLHLALVEHGRRVCTARRPRCSECVVFDLCDAGPRFVAAGEAR